MNRTTSGPSDHGEPTPPYETLLARSRPQLVDHARWLLRGRPQMPDPEDIVQDALSKLHRWLTTPGRNAVDDGLLTLAKKFVETSFHDLLKMNAARKRGGGRAPGPMPETGMQPPSPGTGPFSYVARGERRSRLLQALERLDELDRRIVLMRTEQELSFVEIGSTVGLSENAARMRFNRALKVLRPVLESTLPTEDRR